MSDTIQSKADLKALFETGDTPTQSNFDDLVTTLVANTATGSTANVVITSDGGDVTVNGTPVVLQGNNLSDGAETPTTAINMAERKLVAADETVMANWSNGETGIDLGANAVVGSLRPPGEAVGSIAMATLQLHASTLSVDWANRQLFAADGDMVLVDWSGANDGNSVDFSTDILTHGITGKNETFSSISVSDSVLWSGVPAAGIALDWRNRNLVSNDGTTITASWADGTLKDSLGVAFLAPDGSGAIALAGVNRADVTPALNLDSSQLIASDGVVIVAGWADGTLKDSAGNAFITDATEAALFVAGDKALLDSAVTNDAGVVMLTGLPVTDPAVAGQLWSNSGVLTVSAG